MPARTQPRDKELASEFGSRVRAARENLGLSQERLAERAGVHRTYVGLVERGETTPTLLTVIRIASALGVDPGVLVRGLKASS